MRLVADIGGTNSRFALCHSGEILEQTSKSFRNTQWCDLYAAIAAYLDSADIVPTEMVVAVAGPVLGKNAWLTNLDWSVDTQELSGRFGCNRAHLLNDLTALGHAVPELKPNQLYNVSKGRCVQNLLRQSLVVGVGTGFNASPVLEHDGHTLCPAIEAGHVGMPFGVSTMLAELGIPIGQFPTIESLFSGVGFTTFCHLVGECNSLDGATIISTYGSPEEPQLTFAVDSYAMLLGLLLSDLYFAYMPTSGIYLAGSVARAVLGVSKKCCIEAFQQSEMFESNVRSSMWIIKDDDAALLGCAKY